MSQNVLYLCFTKRELRIEEIEAENRIYETIILTIFIAGIKEEGKGILRNLSDMHLLNVHVATTYIYINPLNHELNPICYLLTLLGAHHFLHVSRIRVKLLTLRQLMSYIWSTHS